MEENQVDGSSNVKEGSKLPDENKNYKDVEYWNGRYAVEDSYEWAKEYSQFKHIFNNAVPDKNSKILIIGCGNSNLSLDLYNDGYISITNIDFSPTVIRKMELKQGHLMKFIQMDMRQLEFSSKFDLVLDKCTLEVLFTSDSSPWTPNEATLIDLNKTLNSIKNVLVQGGKFISVSFAEPYFRRKHYEKYFRNINVETFGDFFHYYFYTCS